ncbi:Fic family protein [Bdellovibrio sp.]|uniref:Fic family protein n=1 Tax=Bdellovibrio TaxID=958 RepID=UPI0032221523
MRSDEVHSSLKLEKGLAAPYENTWFVIPQAPPRETPLSGVLRHLGEANRILQGLPSAASLSSLDRLVLALFVKREAVASSRMEGTWSTIDHVLTPGELYDLNDRSARASVLGYAHALENIFDMVASQGAEALNIDLIKDMHKQIMSGDPDYRGMPGLLRSEEEPPRYVTIGGFPRVENSTYNPAPPLCIPEKMSELLGWMKDDILIDLGNAGMGMSLLVRMVIAHVHFEAIHPFRDGNGRIGRMLMAVQMIGEGFSPLYLSGYIEIKKDQYIKGLEQAQKKLNYAPIVEFFSEAVIECSKEFQITKSALLALPERWQESSGFRKGAAAARMLEHLLIYPIFSVKILMNLLEVSAPAANRAVEQLVDAGIVRERTGFGRNRIFAAEEVISLLSRPMTESVEDSLLRAKSLLGT